MKEAHHEKIRKDHTLNNHKHFFKRNETKTLGPNSKKTLSNYSSMLNIISRQLLFYRFLLLFELGYLN